ncbi:quaternary ammonium compound-resistance protein SugE [Curtobacterium sp. PhB130]|uniref:DMT family transporter n=1 Tax=unclassified Curtobacterium TaxID=257496 RepID=UPI000F4C8A70|nr:MULTISPECIES: multidrug efflux SMR transporter [unclassified Curtobacterium]ROP65217.1 quaternary ammonium compound-resistance protein SugE [Curtobacterium sp. ZW137]ROS78201.1 quaternary ammonium compound-resistance protein SugE [Curtobacterium sp. PhB130]TCK65480.1 quaternary ammonium compound-resistance protein SugE [Curtobacterium sp. PhB136]
MTWIVLVLSGVLEAVWATALGASNGFKKVVPTIVFVVGMAASMAGLAFAMTAIPVGTAYAVWVGIGASLTVLVAIARRQEAASFGRIALVFGLVACVVGLKVVS